MKLVLFSNDINTWKIYHLATNEQYHVADISDRKTLTFKDKDRIDLLRVATKATPQQIYYGTTGEALTFDTDNVMLASQKKIAKRVKTVDRHVLGQQTKDGKITNSDWRNAEKIIETNYDKVLLFQRGNTEESRHYNVIMSTDENRLCFEQFGRDMRI